MELIVQAGKMQFPNGAHATIRISVTTPQRTGRGGVGQNDPWQRYRLPVEPGDVVLYRAKIEAEPYSAVLAFAADTVWRVDGAVDPIVLLDRQIGEERVYCASPLTLLDGRTTLWWELIVLAVPPDYPFTPATQMALTDLRRRGTAIVSQPAARIAAISAERYYPSRILYVGTTPQDAAAAAAAGCVYQDAAAFIAAIAPVTDPETGLRTLPPIAWARGAAAVP